MPAETITITNEGQVRFIYCDELQGLLCEGEAYVRRASQVEPLDCGTLWIADMAPVGGPCLSRKTRGQALDSERDWLNRWMQETH